MEEISTDTGIKASIEEYKYERNRVVSSLVSLSYRAQVKVYKLDCSTHNALKRFANKSYIRNTNFSKNNSH